MVSETLIIALMMGKVMVPETLVVYNETSQLIDRENITKC
jgi:hypothetical protein